MRWWVAVWLALVTALSLIPVRVKAALGTVGVWHNTGHFLVFAATAIFVLFTAREPVSRAFRSASLLLLCAALEALETWIYHNPFEWGDVLIDSLGICCGWLALIAFKPLSSARSAGKGSGESEQSAVT